MGPFPELVKPWRGYVGPAQLITPRRRGETFFRGTKLAPQRSQHVFDAGELVAWTSLRPPIFHLYFIETEPVSEREILGLVLAHQLFHLARLRL